MTTIEKIEKSKHKQERVLVFLQEGDLLRITENELLRFGLYKGKTLSDSEVEALRAAAAHSQVRAAAARMASGRMLSQKELTQRLTKKGAAPEEAQEATRWLADLGAVDDAAYAGVIVRHYGAMGYGAGRVRQELSRRGIPPALWDEALLQLSSPEQAIEQFLRSKCRGAVPDAAAAKKLTAALLRRGFSWNDIRPALRRLGQEICEDEL